MVHYGNVEKKLLCDFMFTDFVYVNNTVRSDEVYLCKSMKIDS